MNGQMNANSLLKNSRNDLLIGIVMGLVFVKLGIWTEMSGPKSCKALASTCRLRRSLDGCLKLVGESGIKPRRSLRKARAS